MKEIINNLIDNELLIPYYQPISSNKSSKIYKYEALARVIKSKEEKEEAVSAYKYIKWALNNDINSYYNITKSIFKQVISHLNENENIIVSINLTYFDIVNDDIVEYIIDKLKDTNLGDRLVFEITEEIKIEDYTILKNFFEKLRLHNCKFSIDDFGTGYSNFAYLIELGYDYLKIDGSIIKKISTCPNSHVIAEYITRLAKILGCKIIAEFVEDEELLYLVNELKIDYTQGEVISLAIPFNEIKQDNNT